MANLLADPNLWFDTGANNPPLSWNAESGAYELSNGPDVFTAFVIQTNAVPDGTVTGTVSFSNSDGLTAYLNLVRKDTLEVLGSQVLNSGDVAIAFEFTAEGASDGYQLLLASSAGGAFETDLYGLNLSVSPASPDPGGECSYDCSCDPESAARNTDTLGNLRSRLIKRLGFIDPLDAQEVRTLADFRRALLVRLGFAANASNPPAGMIDLVDEVVNEAQQLLWRRLELDQSGEQPPRMVEPEDDNVLDYPLVFASALGQLKAHYNKPDAKLYLDQAEKQLGDYMRRSPPSLVHLATDFLQESQRFLFDKVASFRQSRFFYWPLEQGVRFYDFAENADSCERRFVPELVEGVYVTHGDDCTTERWQELRAGISPLLYNGGVRESWPQRYEFRQCIELFPAPDDRPGYLRIKAKFDLQPFEDEDDSTTIDADLVFLQALALSKAHFKQDDAREVAAMVQSKIGDIISGSHHTRRYIPSDGECPPASPPRARDGFIES